MAAGRLCDFSEILPCGGGCGGVLCRIALKLRITFQPVMQNARVIEPKTQCSFVDIHESSMGSWSGGHGLNCLLDLKCCKFVARLW